MAKISNKIKVKNADGTFEDIQISYIGPNGTWSEGGGVASGKYSHAEGNHTLASGSNSHAEGQGSRFSVEVTGDASTKIYTLTKADSKIQPGQIIVYIPSDGTGVVLRTIISYDDSTPSITLGDYLSKSALNNAIAYIYTGGISDGDFSHAEGWDTKAYGWVAHSEGCNTEASGDFSHVEGADTIASNLCSHAEGDSTIASGECSHAEGYRVEASGDYAHAEGRKTLAFGEASHAEGKSSFKMSSDLNGYESTDFDKIISIWKDQSCTVALGEASHTEGNDNLALGSSSHAEGLWTIASGEASHAEGCTTEASGEYSHAEGLGTTASGDYSHAEGDGTQASGNASHAEGWVSAAYGECSHAEGVSVASGNYSHAEGYWTQTTGSFSHAEGHMTQAIGDNSHAEGSSSVASGHHSHAEGDHTEASGLASHAEGGHYYYNGSNSMPNRIISATSYPIIGDEDITISSTTARGLQSHAEGTQTFAFGYSSHAEGYLTNALGDASHAEGIKTIATGESQHVQGKYNIEDPYKTYAHIVGNGTAEDARSNAHTLDWNGNAWFAGDIRIGSVASIYASNGQTTGLKVNRMWHFGDNTEVAVIHKNDSWYSLSPTTDANNGSKSLGSSNYRWKQLYASTTTINTSDKNQKRDINDLDDKYIQLFDLIRPTSYYLKNGDRIHTGFIAQEVEDAMTKVGLTTEELGFFCRDIKTEPVYNEDGEYIEDKKVYDEDGNPVYIYGLRYSEYIAIMAAKIKKLEEKYDDKIETLEKENTELRTELNELKLTVQTLINQK